MTSTNEPLFTDASMIRRVHREGVTLLGGGRALLMQIAHPAVAAGVAEHSSFRSDPVQRLLRTLRPTLAIAFGTRAQAERAVALINATHRKVTGPGYSATDPALLLWVLATLIDTALLMHERFVRPLSSAELEAYYEDMVLAGGLLGIPSERMPAGMSAFKTYMEDMVSSLEVSETGRQLATELFHPGSALAPAMGLLRVLTSGLLPTTLRAQFGLPWSPIREASLQVAEKLSRRVVPLLPALLRAPPPFLLPPAADPGGLDAGG
ncbi:MAG: DUF2236 domain-containing protein [Chloroflexi bacterium]|nr:DUF2236 domain-containing protein [Chloroflexota bacterium]MCI0890847.1 DUF2236 domain-containing protein [Chloroflexota bacterium]